MIFRENNSFLITWLVGSEINKNFRSRETGDICAVNSGTFSETTSEIFSENSFLSIRYVDSEVNIDFHSTRDPNSRIVNSGHFQGKIRPIFNEKICLKIG